MTDKEIIELNFDLGYILTVFAELYNSNKDNPQEREKALSRIIQYINKTK